MAFLNFRAINRYRRTAVASAAVMAALLGPGTAVNAADEAAAADVAAQGEKHFATCIACHGADGGGNAALGAPALAGQLEIYLSRQLMMFRRGIRGGAEGDSYGAQMTPFANMLPDNDAVKAVAAYLSALPAVPVAAPENGDAGKGASLYNGNCGACHGGAAEGNEALKAPRLAGLDSAYLKRQFEYFKSGVRGSNPRDRLGKQMAVMASSLPDDKALEDVIAYIGSLGSAAGAE